MRIPNQQLNKIKNRRKPPERKLPATIQMQKIKLSNSDLAFYLDVEPVVSIDLISQEENQQTNTCQVPTVVSNEVNSLYTRVIKTDNVELSRQIGENIDNFEVLDQIIAKNPKEIQQMFIPYLEKDTFKSEGKIKQSSNVSFKPSSYKDRSFPENLSVYAMFVSEDLKTGKKIALSPPQMQRVVSHNVVLPSDNVLDLRQLKYDEYLRFDIINQVEDNKEAYFSDQYYSIDPSGFIKFMFFWNKLQFLREKSLFGNILKNGSIPSSRSKMISDSRISDLRIIRKRVKRSIDGFSMFDKAQYNPVVIYSSDDADGDFISAESKNTKTGQLKAKIGPLSRIKNSQDYLTFAVDDYYSLKTRIGMYKYEVKIEVEDGMLKYLLDSLDKLRNINSDFLKYQNSFFGSIARRNSTTPLINQMLNVLFSLRKLTRKQMETIRKEFNILATHKEGYQKIMDFNMQLMTKIQDALGKRGNVKSDNKSASYKKNTSKLFFLEDTQEFSEIVDFSQINTIKSEYFDIKSISNIGIARFSTPSVKNRFLGEFKKGVNFEGPYEEINFSDLNEKFVSSNTMLGKTEELSSSLFDFADNFFSYLSPAIINMDNKHIKNETTNPQDFMATQPIETLQLSQQLADLGVRILLPSKTELTKKSSEEEEQICSELVMGSDNNMSSQKTYENNSDISYTSRLTTFNSTINKSQSLINGIKNHYNNFNLQKDNYDLDSPKNLLIEKKKKEPAISYTHSIKDMPNQLRVLFGSKSDLVKNKWNSTENDFFVNPSSSKMMKENYSNLIRIEVLSGFKSDSSGQPNIKLPIFNKLQISDIDGLQSGESLFCRTYMVDNQSLGLGQRRKTENDSNYYNKHFIISTEGGD